MPPTTHHLIRPSVTILNENAPVQWIKEIISTNMCRLKEVLLYHNAIGHIKENHNQYHFGIFHA